MKHFVTLLILSIFAFEASARKHHHHSQNAASPPAAVPQASSTGESVAVSEKKNDDRKDEQKGERKEKKKKKKHLYKKSNHAIRLLYQTVFPPGMKMKSLVFQYTDIEEGKRCRCSCRR